MELQHINKLLEKYYDGKSTLKEEQELKSFFQKSDIPEELKIEQMKFNFYRDAVKETSSKNYSEKIVSKERFIWSSPRNRFLTGIAASLVVAIGIGFFLNRNDSKTVSAEDELAYNETKKALFLISEKLNKGTEDLHKFSKLNEIQTLISTKK